MKKLSILILISIMIMGSCKKDDEPAEITPEMAKDSLYYIMNIYYYWYNLMPAVDRNAYSNPYDLLNAMRYKELDRWSFVADYESFLAQMEGDFVGHGIMVALSEDNTVRIAQIYKNAPLYANGVRRGWILKTVNGYDMAKIFLDGDNEAYDAAFGPKTEGITNSFVFEKPDGSIYSVSSTKTKFTINTVILYDTIWLDAAGTKKAGHLVFDYFIIPSSQELQTAFSFFKANGVTDLIVDLRYNPGGYLDVTQQLASYIGGNSLSGRVFATLSYNNKLQSLNNTYRFLSSSYSLTIPRVVVITSRATASASEAIINGLSPHMTVVTVGDTTEGKCVGMDGFVVGKKYLFSPITFKIVNSLGQGDYFDGLIPDQLATDDITHDYDDRREACLKEAILYLQTGSFSGKGAGEFHKTPTRSERPAWMNNAFKLQ
jgi:C-terminal processing protease CtpA/Prc